MMIQIDTREKPRAIRHIVMDFDRYRVPYFRSKLVCGDYCDLDNARFCVDRKQNLLELCQNIGKEHKRFSDELRRAQRLGIKLVFLVENSEGIQCLDDVRRWVNPRLKVSPAAISGNQLYKTLLTIERVYDTKFYFCSTYETGFRIVELLRGAVKK